ncbi:MAG: cytochrome c [bacterium]|nr:cytochrome c [bacterium]
MDRRSCSLAILVFLAALAGCAHHRPAAAVAAYDDAVPTPSNASAGRGATLYAQQCAACHGARGGGGQLGPTLQGEHTRKALGAVVAILENPDPPMPKLFPGVLSAQDVADLAAYVERL